MSKCGQPEVSGVFRTQGGAWTTGPTWPRPIGPVLRARSTERRSRTCGGPKLPRRCHSERPRARTWALRRCPLRAGDTRRAPTGHTVAARMAATCPGGFPMWTAEERGRERERGFLYLFSTYSSSSSLLLLLLPLLPPSTILIFSVFGGSCVFLEYFWVLCNPHA